MVHAHDPSMWEVETILGYVASSRQFWNKVRPCFNKGGGRGGCSGSIHKIRMFPPMLCCLVKTWVSQTETSLMEESSSAIWWRIAAVQLWSGSQHWYFQHTQNNYIPQIVSLNTPLDNLTNTGVTTCQIKWLCSKIREARVENPQDIRGNRVLCTGPTEDALREQRKAASRLRLWHGSLL